MHVDARGLCFGHKNIRYLDLLRVSIFEFKILVVKYLPIVSILNHLGGPEYLLAESFGQSFEPFG
jgi:hypothetical protein